MIGLYHKGSQMIIPEGVTSIGDRAFLNCTGLTQINLPARVTSIGILAFWGCTGLTQINLPEALTSIGDFAFYGCTGLTQMVIPAGVTSIGDTAFLSCTGLTHMILPNQFCTDAEKVRLRIPEAVPCISYRSLAAMNTVLNDVLKIEGGYSVVKQELLYRLSRDRTFHPDELKGLKDCSFNDVMKAIQSRYTTLGAEGDIPGFNGLFGRPRIDQVVAVAKLNLTQTVSAMPEDLTRTLLSYMTVKDVMNCCQCKRGGSGLSSQSLFKHQEAGGNGAEQVADITPQAQGQDLNGHGAV